jgi:hypothetical protein
VEIDGVAYPCGVCHRAMAPDDQAVQTVRVTTRRAVSGETITERTHGEWFHAVCFGFRRPGFEEIDRGVLADVLARS